MHPIRSLANPRHGVPGVVTLNAAGFRRAKAEITGWAGYAPTPLVPLDGLAEALGIASLHIKDESPRFGLGSFKALGGAYAVLNVIRAGLSRAGVPGAIPAAVLEAGAHREAVAAIAVCCATDGNHGLSVAWGARRFGAACHIFVHPDVTPGRLAAIAAQGATLHTVPGTYDDAVRAATETAAREGWVVVSDTSWPGYTEIPREIMQGYRLMVDEALDQLPAPPTHVVIQAGVGGVAAAVAVHARSAVTPEPQLIVVEPDKAACLFASALAGTATKVPGALDTIMGCLACGEPSLLAWQELERSAAVFLAIPDPAVVDVMRLLARQGVVSGESGAAGLAGLLLAAGAPETRGTLRLQADSRVLAFSTEGGTDPVTYAELLGR